MKTKANDFSKKADKPYTSNNLSAVYAGVCQHFRCRYAGQAFAGRIVRRVTCKSDNLCRKSFPLRNDYRAFDVCAQYWGKNDRVSVEKIFAYVMKITAAVAFTFFVISLLIPKLLMRLFTNDMTLIEGGAVYLKTVSVSYFLTGISQIYLCILKKFRQVDKGWYYQLCQRCHKYFSQCGTNFRAIRYAEA